MQPPSDASYHTAGPPAASSSRLATRAPWITDLSQVVPANAVRAVELGAIAQRQFGAAACFARPPEPPAMPAAA